MICSFPPVYVFMFLFLSITTATRLNLKQKLPGTYYYFDFNALHETPTNVKKVQCPKIVQITGTQAKPDGIYIMDYKNNLKIDNNKCDVKKGGSSSFTLLPFQKELQNGTASGSTSWFSTLKPAFVTCLSAFSGTESTYITIAETTIIFSGVPSVSMPKASKLVEDAMKNRNAFVSIATGEQGCSYFRQSDHSTLMSLVQTPLSNAFPTFSTDVSKAMLFENSSLERICTCPKAFPQRVDVQFKDKMAEAKYKSGQGMDMPNIDVIFDSEKCTTRPGMNVTKILQKGRTINSKLTSSGNALVDLGAFGFVSKLFDEVSSLLGEKSEMDKLPFQVRRGLAVELLNATKSNYGILFRQLASIQNGSRCGRTIQTENSIIVLEKSHILDQLRHRSIISKTDQAEMKTTLSQERLLKQAFTLHILRPHNGNFQVCTYTSSSKSIKILSPFCTSFIPLGSVRTPSSAQLSAAFSPRKEATSVKPSAKPAPSSNEKVIQQKPSALPSKSASPTLSPSRAKASVSPTPSKSPPAKITIGDTGISCFPAEARVQMKNGSLRRMDELKVGDEVRDETGGYSRILLFAHADNSDTVRKFVQIDTKVGGIILSEKHYLHVNGRLSTADSVKTGDMVQVMKIDKGAMKKEARVMSVKNAHMRGLYNPQTVSGSIGVIWNGDIIIASTYTSAIHPRVAHLLLAPLRWIDTYVGIVLPSLSRLFTHGSQIWSKILPTGSTHIL